MKNNFTEEQKEIITSLSGDELIMHIVHSTRAPINCCISCIELIQQLSGKLNEEQTQLIDLMKKNLLPIQMHHEEMSIWLDFYRKNHNNE